MNSFRQNYLSTAFSFITGILFLNMSFFLTEVSLLNITDHQIAAHIAKLISTNGFEEERDGETSEKGTSAKEVDLLIDLVQTHHRSLFLITTKVNRMLDDLYPHANYSQTFSPPPDTFHFA